MSAQLEKLTAVLAAVKATIRTLKAESTDLKAKFKEELKAAKAGQKTAVKKATKKVSKPNAKKTTSKVTKKTVVPHLSKGPTVKKAKAPKVVKQEKSDSNVGAEEKAEENVTFHDDFFSHHE